jgi:hypothetical protein
MLGEFKAEALPIESQTGKRRLKAVSKPPQQNAWQVTGTVRARS